jgi:hypothetical protein
MVTVQAMPPVTKELPPVLPTEIVKFREKSGAKVGWMGRDKECVEVFREKADGLIDPVPAIVISPCRLGWTSVPGMARTWS